MKKNHRTRFRGQAAMEYLLTYGWAIAAVMVIGAAFWSLGALSEPGGTMSAVGFTFFKLMPAASTSKDGLLVLVFQNTLPSTVKLNTTHSTVTDETTGNACPTRVFVPDQVPPGGTFKVEIMDCLRPRTEDYRIAINILSKENLGGTQRERTEKGTITGKQTITSRTGCTTSNGDTFYVKGYACDKNGCKSDHCLKVDNPAAEGEELAEEVCDLGVVGELISECPCYDGACKS